MQYLIVVASALGMASLTGFAADFQSPALSSDTVVAWGKSVAGLRVGVSCATNGTTSGILPKICFYVSNDGDKDLPGIIQSGTMCLVAMNGQYYAQTSWGGKSSWMTAAPKSAVHVKSLTDDELLGLFPDTPVGLASVGGKKRLIFPRPGDEARFIIRL